MRRVIGPFSAAFACCISVGAIAAPMGFKGSWMAMGDFSPNWRETLPFNGYARDVATLYRGMDLHRHF